MTDPYNVYTPKSLDKVWPDFLKWIADYVGSDYAAANAVYSREDMRNAFQAGLNWQKKQAQNAKLS